MSRDTYELLAYIARYWFAILALVVVFRGWRACVRDNRSEKLLRAWEGGAGCVGELVLLDDGTRRRRKERRRYQVPAEAVLGSGAAADIRLRGRDIRRKHIFMTYRPGEMVLHPVNGAAFDAPRLPDATWVLRDGDTLSVGRMKLQMVFFDAADAAPRDAPQDEFEGVWE